MGISDGNTNRGRDRATAADPAAWQALRDALDEHKAGMPAAWRANLLDEATDLLDASGRHLATLRPGGMLTRRGLVRAAYKDYLGLQERLERVLELLGFEPAKPAAGKPGLPDRVLRRMTPAARQAYEEGQ